MPKYRHLQTHAGMPCNKRYTGGRRKQAGFNHERPATNLFSVFAVQSSICTEKY
jgi:hypothetical protein